MEHLRDIVFHTLGQASRCWNDDETLDSDGIIEMGDTLMKAIEAYKDEAVKKAVEEKSKPTMTSGTITINGEPYRLNGFTLY